MKTLIFTLTMPGVASWNGRWSGEGVGYYKIIKVKDDKAKELDGQSFGYSWEDGWRANVSCRISEGSADTRKTKKASKGFCGYEWMVRSILSKGCIETEG